jgi:diacylglycerol diphosphate phosphatase/phosphatidate phosphatase
MLKQSFFFFFFFFGEFIRFFFSKVDFIFLQVAKFKLMLAAFYRIRGPEWLFTLVVGGLAMGSGEVIAPYCREFFWNDPSIARPYVEDADQTFPSWALVPIVVLPVVVMWLLLGWHAPLAHRLRQERNAWALAQAQTVMLQLSFVQFCKTYAGRLRPDFLSRMALLGFTPTPGIASHCDLIHHEPLIWKGHQSFPSGHSSTSFGAMVPLSFFLMNFLQPMQRSSIFRLSLSLLPLFLACTVAVSRTRDNRHHFSDILGGSAIGAAAAILSLKLNFSFSKTTQTWVAKDTSLNMEASDSLNSEA